MAENRSEFVIKGRSVGFDKVEAAQKKIGVTGKRAMADLASEGKRLEKVLVGIVRHQADLLRQLQGVKKGTEAYKQLARQFKEVATEASHVSTVVSGINRATAERRRKEGAFTQGVLQGAIPEAAYLQRGPGMFRQAIGVEVGKSLRGVTSGLANTFTQGVGGIVQALQSLPGGGFLAAPLTMTMGFAQQFLGYQQQQMQAMPFLRGNQQAETMRQARNRLERERPGMLAAAPGVAAERAERAIKAMGLPAETPEQEAARLAEERRPKPFWEGAFGGKGRKWKPAQAVQSKEDLRRDLIVQFQAEEEARIKALKARPMTVEQKIREQGLAVGMAAPEALQLAAGVSRAGGGTGMEMMRQRMVPAAFAAERLYGVGAETSGAFLQAGRRGGLLGGEGRAGQALTDSLSDALRLGLQGSEITQYVDQIAQGIQQWRQTGIPVNKDAINALSKGMSLGGLGVVRGQAVAQQLAGAAQGLSTRAPQTAEELMMLQELGGWQPGTGAAGYEAAQIQLEEGGGLKPENVQRLLKRAMAAGGGGASGRQVARQMLRGFGVTVSAKEMQGMGAAIEGGEMPPELAARIEQARREQEAGAEEAARQRTPEEMAALAAGRTPGEQKRQASLTNQEIEMGKASVNAMLDLEQTTRHVANAFTQLALKGGPLDALATQTRDLASAMPELAKKLRAIASGDYGKIVVGDGG